MWFTEEYYKILVSLELQKMISKNCAVTVISTNKYVAVC